MKREDVRAFLKAGADALSMQFDSGRLTEFNKVADKRQPFAWVESLNADTDFNNSTLIDNWDVRIHISMFDTIDSVQSEYEAIIDTCDQLARKLIWQYNLKLYDSSLTSTANQAIYKLITLSGVSRESFIKRFANPPLTGVILAFTLTVPDKTNVC